MSGDREETVRDLQELIEALDRRSPQIDRSGERKIADEAASLRRRAVKRLAQLAGWAE